MLAALSLKDFTVNNIFSSLNSVQVIMFFVAMVFVLAFGLVLGGIIFYSTGFKQGKKKGEESIPKKEYYKKEEANLEAQMEAIDSKPKKVVTLDFSDEEFNIDELDLEDELEFTDFAVPSENAAQDGELDVVPLSLGEKKETESVDPLSVLDDPDFAALVRNRKKEVPVLTRRYILKYVNSLLPISETETVSLTMRTPEEPFDTASAGDYPFLFIFSISGLRTLIFADERYDLYVRGERTSFIRIVIMRMMIP